MGPRNLLRAILTSAVDHNDLVGNPFDRAEGARQVMFLVQGDQANGETIHCAPELGVELVSHNSIAVRPAVEAAQFAAGVWAISLGSSRESSCCRCEIRRHPITWPLARVPLRKRFRSWSPCLSG